MPQASLQMTYRSARLCKALTVVRSDGIRNRFDKRGFTLVEVIVASALIAILATFAIPTYNAYIKNTKNKACMADIRTIEKDINAYLVDKNFLPDSLTDIGRDNLRDPWGNPYQYKNLVSHPAAALKDFLGKNLNEDFDLYSLGSDGASAQNFNGEPTSENDIARANEGGYVGLRF